MRQRQARDSRRSSMFDIVAPPFCAAAFVPPIDALPLSIGAADDRLPAHCRRYASSLPGSSREIL